MPEHSHLTVSPRDSDEDVTFRATIYEDIGTAISVMGPARMVLDQVAINPSDGKKDCGVSLTYRQTNEHHTHLAGLFVVSREDERRLVEWLHSVGGDFVIETTERLTASIEQASYRGRCAGCGEYFAGGHSWSIHERQEDGYDLYFCDYDCLVASR